MGRNKLNNMSDIGTSIWSERHRWVMIFHELGLIPYSIKWNFMKSKTEYEYDEVEREILNKAKNTFIKTITDPQRRCYYSNYYNRAIFFPKVSELLNQKPTLYEVIQLSQSDLDTLGDTTFQFEIRSIIDNTSNRMTIPNLLELDILRKSGELEFYDTYIHNTYGS